MQRYISKFRMGFIGIVVILIAGIIISLNNDKKPVSTELELAAQRAQPKNENSANAESNITSGLGPSGNIISSREEVLGHNPEPTSNYGRVVDKQEMERFKEKTKEHTKVLYRQMRDDEIESLKISIEKNEKLLKEIEASGSNAQDYENIQNHLEKHKKRLNELSKTE